MKNETVFNFEAIEHLSLENSFGTIKEAEVTLQVSVGVNEKVVGIDENGQSEIEYYGWFELYDKATGGGEWYAEGGLWFKDKLLVDYDGVYSLPECVLDCLRENGFDTSYIEG